MRAILIAVFIGRSVAARRVYAPSAFMIFNRAGNRKSSIRATRSGLSGIFGRATATW